MIKEQQIYAIAVIFNDISPLKVWSLKVWDLSGASKKNIDYPQ